jgi:hypothetical protein
VTDTDELTRQYATLPDERVIQLAMFEAEDLQPHALQVIKAEIRRRGLPGILVDAVEIHERGLPEGERQRLVAWLRQHPCPVCGGTDQLLNGILFEGTLSFYFVINLDRSSLLIGCGECLAQQVEALHEPSLNEAAKQREPTLALLDFVDNNVVPLYLRMKAGQSAFEEYDPLSGED